MLSPPPMIMLLLSLLILCTDVLSNALLFSSDEDSDDLSILGQRMAVPIGSGSGSEGEECKEAPGLESTSSSKSADETFMIQWLLYGLLSATHILIIHVMAHVMVLHSRAISRLKNMKLVEFLSALFFLR